MSRSWTRNLVGSAHCPLCPNQTFFMVYCFYHFKIIGSIIIEYRFFSNISVTVLAMSLIFIFLFPTLFYYTTRDLRLATQLSVFLLYLWMCSIFSYSFVFPKFSLSRPGVKDRIDRDHCDYYTQDDSYSCCDAPI